MIGKKKTAEDAKATAPKAAPAYLVKFENAPGIMGITKAVDFVHGHGVLDRTAIVSANAGYLGDKDALTTDGLLVLESLADYWKRAGATVEKVSQSEAAAYRAHLAKNPKAHLPKDAPKSPQSLKAATAKTGATSRVDKASQPPHRRPKE